MLNLRKKDRNLYIELMASLKALNADWISLRSGSEYKIGMVIHEIFQALKKFQFKKIVKLIYNWVKSRKSSKVKSNYLINPIDDSESSNYFSDERIAVYTAVFGNYDKIEEPIFVPDNCDFYVFTNQDFDDEHSVWKKLDIPSNISDFSDILKNRYLKMHPDVLFENYKYSIYVDGNVKIITDLTEYIYRLNDIGIGIHLHHLRSCVYDELKAILKSGKDSKDNIMKHKKYLLETKMPEGYGLLQCNVIVREHHNSKCKAIMKQWWNEFLIYSKRDQISLPHVLFLNKIPVEFVGTLGNNVYTNPSFRVLKHK